MKINFQSVFKTLDGEVIKENGKEVTLKQVAQNALLATTDDEKTLSGEDKVKRYELASKLDGDTEITPEDVVLLRKQIGKIYTPLVVGQAFNILK